VAFHAGDGEGAPLRLEAASGERPAHLPVDAAWLRYALRGPSPLQGSDREGFSELAVPVRAGGQVLGVLEVVRFAASAFSDEELNLLSAVAGQMAVAIQKSERTAEAERLARQMAVLYDLALETDRYATCGLSSSRRPEETGGADQRRPHVRPPLRPCGGG
jgi:GAF domain-containing protein